MEQTELITAMKRLETAINNAVDVYNESQAKERWQHIPQAANRLGLSQNTLRKYCKEGRVPSKLMNPNSKKLHYLVDVVEANKALASDDLKQYTK